MPILSSFYVFRLCNGSRIGSEQSHGCPFPDASKANVIRVCPSRLCAQIDATRYRLHSFLFFFFLPFFLTEILSLRERLHPSDDCHDTQHSVKMPGSLAV